MKIRLIFTALLAAALTFTACKKPTPQLATAQKAADNFDTSDVKTTPLDVKEAQNLTLRYHPATGSVYTYRYTNLTEEKGSVKADSAMNMTTTQKMTYTLQFKTNEYEDDGTIDLAVTVISVKVDANTGREKFSYESGKPVDPKLKELFSDYDALINNSFGLRLKPNGTVVEYYKTDKVVNKIFQLRKISKDTIPDQTMKMLKDKIIYEFIAPAVQPIFRDLSDTPVSKDSKWTTVQDPLGLQVVAFSRKLENTLTGVEMLGQEKVASVDIKLFTQSKVNPEISKMKINLTKYGLAGQGKMYFNLQKGMNQKIKSNMVLSLGMTRQVPTAQGMQSVATDKTTTVTNLIDLIEIK